MTLGSSGADIVEGVAALHGWGLAAKAIAKCSGYVPILTVVTGPAVSGPALLIGLSDIVIMTSNAYAFVTGPTMVAEFTGVVISNDELGGSDIHAKQSGVAHLVVADRETAFAEVEHVLVLARQCQRNRRCCGNFRFGRSSHTRSRRTDS